MPTYREGGVFDAKTHLSELLSEVEAGVTLTITRRGTPVARIVPIAKHSDRTEALHRLRSVGAETRATTGGFSAEELHEWRAEGRR